MALLECKVIHFVVIVQISALKQNGVLQTLASGGDQPEPAGNLDIRSHSLPSGICEGILDATHCHRKDLPQECRLHRVSVAAMLQVCLIRRIYG